MKLPFSYLYRFPFFYFLHHRSFIIALYSLWMLPTILLLVFVSHKKEQFEEIKSEIECLTVKMKRIKEYQKERNAFFKKYSNVDPYYIDHKLESLKFLKPEVEVLRLIMASPSFKSCDSLKRRLHFLTEEGNHFILAEGNRKVLDQVEEIEFSQKRPIELNGEDLKEVLAVIEGISIGKRTPPSGRPQLIIKKFNLNKKKVAERETYQLDVELIKRDVLI